MQKAEHNDWPALVGSYRAPRRTTVGLGPETATRVHWAVLERMRWVVLSCLALAVLAGAGSSSSIARAQAPARPRLVVIMDGSTGRLRVRIGEELDTMGFEPVVLVRNTTTTDELAELTRQAGGVAGAHISIREHSVQLWLLDRTTGKTLMRKLERPSDIQESALALHTVELLRASLLELKLPNAPRGEVEASDSLLRAARVPPTADRSRRSERSSVAPRPPAPASPAPNSATSVPPSERVRDPALALELGLAALDALGNLKPFAALAVGGAWFASPELRVGAVAFVPLTGMTHEAAEGSSETRVTLAGAELRWQDTLGTWRPFGALGFSVVRLGTRGQTSFRVFEGRRDHATSVGGFVRLGLGVQLAPSLRLSPQLITGVQHAYFVIDYVGRDAATWGPLWGGGSLMMEGDFE